VLSGKGFGILKKGQCGVVQGPCGEEHLLEEENMGLAVHKNSEPVIASEPFGRLNELVKQAGGCVAIDGGFATQLERHGAEINDPLWSALCLITMPELIRKVISHVLPLLRLQVVPNQSPGRC